MSVRGHAAESERRGIEARGPLAPAGDGVAAFIEDCPAAFGRGVRQGRRGAEPGADGGVLAAQPRAPFAQCDGFRKIERRDVRIVAVAEIPRLVRLHEFREAARCFGQTRRHIVLHCHSRSLHRRRALPAHFPGEEMIMQRLLAVAAIAGELRQQRAGLHRCDLIRAGGERLNLRPARQCHEHSSEFAQQVIVRRRADGMITPHPPDVARQNTIRYRREPSLVRLRCGTEQGVNPGEVDQANARLHWTGPVPAGAGRILRRPVFQNHERAVGE